MKAITKDTKVLDAMRLFPSATKIIKDSGIDSMSVLDTLEKGTPPNRLRELLDKLNNGYEEFKKPKPIDTEKALIITESAAKELKHMMEIKGKKGYGLRFGAHSPSPNQYAYNLEFEKKPDKKKDIVIEKEGFKIFVSKSDFPLLGGSVIDYNEEGGGFKITKKPNKLPV